MLFTSVKKKAWLWILPVCAVGLIMPTYVEAGSSIRMYKINKKKQQRRIMFGNAAEQPGCHNLIYAKKVYRVAQVGFAWCSVYAEDDCVADSVLPARWTGGEYHKYGIDGSKPQPKLYPGSQWNIISADTPVHSWYCEAKSE